ncbi:MAG: SufD family Fe-S cluster assembly protein, partial [Bacteroidaceae bacterium]|nr:SufD family Fe-S cluster assembly protein [Bacteroidaceae bacterium]MCF0194309.1 SufD family Fe-S cluster assembly protein [Bacteroidaceae bacterium]
VIADGQQHIDHATIITHDAPDCHSRQLYKYVLDDHATGAFAGRILVPHGMQRTTSDMVNANLISAPTARIYTQPMLEIYADDVQCSHGSTVGQLSDAALIYMRQRGIPDSEARLLLKQAFASQVIESIQIPTLRDRLHHLVEKRFRQELTHCASCQLCKK